jgi:PIN domain nuclease of toxin-antitoxin system
MLIDTHILLWFRLGDTRLNKDEIEELISEGEKGNLCMSAISIWEIAMLHKQQRITLHQPIEKWIQIATQGIKVLPITTDIALESVNLPHFSHKDPADRMIIATARVLGLELLSKDQKIIDYVNLGYL